MVSIVVRGSAERRLAPDRGTVHLVARLEGTDRAAIAAEVADVHERLVQDALQHVQSGAATRWSADQVRLGTTERFTDHAVTVLHVADATIEVRFCRFDALAAWVSELAGVAGVVLERIDWSVADARRAEALREVRTEAVRDAQKHAADYARALGLEALELRALYEPGLRPGASGDATSAARALADHGGAEFALSPQDIEVRASVSADFEAA